MTEIKTNEQILDAFLADYPWRWESKANALKAMQESNDQAVRVVLDLVNAKYGHMYRMSNIAKDAIHSRVMEKLKTPAK